MSNRAREIKERAKANIVEGGSHGGKGPQNSANPCAPIETREEIAKLAGVEVPGWGRWLFLFLSGVSWKSGSHHGIGYPLYK